MSGLGLVVVFYVFMFQVLSWNVRGLNDLGKRGLVKSVIASYKGSVVCIQETKLHLILRSFLRSFAGPRFDKCHFIRSDGASDGIVTCSNSRDFICLEVVVRIFSLTLRLKHFSTGLTFYITNVYGPPTWEEKEDFCRELAALKGFCRGP